MLKRPFNMANRIFLISLVLNARLAGTAAVLKEDVRGLIAYHVRSLIILFVRVILDMAVRAYWYSIY